MATKIQVYQQQIPPDILKENPKEKWRCDIVVASGWESHHGIGETEHEAILNAAAHYYGFHESKRAKS